LILDHVDIGSCLFQLFQNVTGVRFDIGSCLFQLFQNVTRVRFFETQRINFSKVNESAYELQRLNRIHLISSLSRCCIIAMLHVVYVKVVLYASLRDE